MKVTVINKHYDTAYGIMCTLGASDKDAAQYLYDRLNDTGLLVKASHSSTSDRVQVTVPVDKEDELFRLISTMEPPTKAPGNPIADGFWKSMCDKDAPLEETRDLATLYLADCIPCSAEYTGSFQFVLVTYRGVKFTAELCFAHEDSQVLIYQGDGITDYTARHISVKKGDDLRAKFSQFFEELHRDSLIVPVDDRLPPDDRIARLEDTVAKLANQYARLEADFRNLQDAVRAK